MGAERANLQGRDGVGQVIDRTGWTGKMQHIVDRAVDLDRLGDVVFDESERRVINKLCNVAPAAGQKVVHADDFVAITHESLAKVRPDEPRSPSNDCSHGESLCHVH